MQLLGEFSRMRAVATVIAGEHDRLGLQLCGERHAGEVRGLAGSFFADGDHDVRSADAQCLDVWSIERERSEAMTEEVIQILFDSAKRLRGCLRHCRLRFLPEVRLR